MSDPNCIGCKEGWPRVTEVLSSKPKPYLETWKAKWGVLAERKTSASNKIGTAFHSAVENYNKGLLSLMHSYRVNSMVAAYRGWATVVDFQMKHSELHIYSKEHKYHGTLDAVGTLEGKPELILMDWKTSSKIYPDMALQLSAYAGAYEEMTGVKLKRGVIVLVSKDKPKHKLTVKEYRLDKLKFREFLQRKKEMEAESEC